MATPVGNRLDEARLAVARHAAELFWKNGVEGTSGDAIAAAAGISKRTVWRYFRSKEACVEPLFLATGLKFVGLLEAWPRDVSIEAYLQSTMALAVTDTQELQDSIAAVRIIAIMPENPMLRSAWLMACSYAETQLASVVAARAGLMERDAEVRMCAATIMAAIRVTDEEISFAAVKEGRVYDHTEIAAILAAAIRAASTLPIADPVE